MEIRANNITWHEGHVNRPVREKLLQQRGCTIWMTGLSASGKHRGHDFMLFSFQAKAAAVGAAFLLGEVDGMAEEKKREYRRQNTEDNGNKRSCQLSSAGNQPRKEYRMQ